MTEPRSETEKHSGSSLGRRIATAVVLGGIAYLIGVGIYSVIPQVFSPPTATLPDDLTCTDGLTDIRAELLSHAATRIEQGGSDSPDDLRAWLRGWDRHHAALETRCQGDELGRWEMLGLLRRRLQGTLERYDREVGELARATNRASST